MNVAARISRAGRQERRRPGFTLMEMMVVIGLIALMATMALPSIIAMFNSGADAQAYNLISAQLTAARALAIEKSSYAGVHVQIADPDIDPDYRPGLKTEVCYSALVLYHPTDRKFRVHSEPRRTPGAMAYGKVTDGDGASVGTGAGGFTGDAKDVEKFTCFTVVFSPSGAAVRRVEGQNIIFHPDDPIFKVQTVVATDIAGSRQLWDRALTGGNSGQQAVTALCLFDLAQYVPRSVGDRTTYLDENARYLPLNVHTGQLFPRE